MRFRQVHLDYHNSPYIENVGNEFNEKDFERMLLKGHIDSITLFAKCHHGYSYFDSELIPVHPSLKYDLLNKQIRVCKRLGIKTPIYISAGIDERIANLHRNFVRRNADESTSWAKNFVEPGFHELCFNSPYLKILIEQVKEVLEKVDCKDGLFFDITGVKPCYCQYCMQDIFNENKDISDYKNVYEKAEKTYKNFYQTIISLVAKYNPEIPIFFNSGHILKGRYDLINSTSHLEIESLPTGGWGYDNFPMTAKYVNKFNKEYLGMTGKFHLTWGEFGGFKHPNALVYETSLNLAMGAKCCVGDQLHPSGKFDEATYELIGKAYSLVEQKEKWCKNVKNISDVAFVSVEANKNLHNEFCSSDISDIGINRLLLENHYLFDVIDENMDFSIYKVLILPDNIKLNEQFIIKLNKYISSGGKVLACGSSVINDNAVCLDFGCEYKFLSEYKQNYIITDFDLKDISKSAFVIYNSVNILETTTGKSLAKIQNPYFERKGLKFCSHQHTPNSLKNIGDVIVEGKGGIYISFDIATEYATVGNIVSKQIFLYALEKLLRDNKILETDLPSEAIVTLNRQNKNLLLHIVFANKIKRGNTGIEVVEDLIPLYDIPITLKLTEPPKNILLQPEGEKILFDYVEGVCKFRIEKVICHQIVEIQY